MLHKITKNKKNMKTEEILNNLQKLFDTANGISQDKVL